MGWREKLDAARQKVAKDEGFWDVCDLHEGADPAFVDRVREVFPFVDPEYLEFLRYSDGGRIDVDFFFGSGKPHFIPDRIHDPSFFRCPGLFQEVDKLNEEILGWRDPAELGPFLPFLRSITGDLYRLIMPDHRILEIDCEGKDIANDCIVANSFAELLDDHMFGPRYPILYGCDSADEWESISENDWTRFLNDQGWWVH